MYFKSEPIDIESIQVGVCQRIIEFALSVGFCQTYRRRYREVWTRGRRILPCDLSRLPPRLQSRERHDDRSGLGFSTWPQQEIPHPET